MSDVVGEFVLALWVAGRTLVNLFSAAVTWAELLRLRHFDRDRRTP